MSRGMWQRVVTIALGILAGGVAAAGTLAVATAGFTLSYDAIRKVGIASGVRPDWSWLLPVSIDGAMAVATVTAVVMRRMGRSSWYPWVVVLAGSAISISCNAVHAKMRDHIQLDDRTAMAVSAIPAVMLVLSVHLLVVLIDAGAHALGQSATPTEQVGKRADLSARTEGEQADRSGEQGPVFEPAGRANGHRPTPLIDKPEPPLDIPAGIPLTSTDTPDEAASKASGQRTDAQLVGLHGDELFDVLRRGGQLSRYRVEQICSVSARQAERIRVAIEDLYDSYVDARTGRTEDEQGSTS